MRLRNVGDTRPAASLFQAVEHQALVGVMAERGGVQVPSVDRVVRADDGTGAARHGLGGRLLAGPAVADQIGDDLLVRLWTEVDKLHRAGIAHRSLRAANVMVDSAGLPQLVDFSFSELAATERQLELDVAELIASLADPGRRGPSGVRGRRAYSAPRGSAGGAAAAATGPVRRHAARRRGTRRTPVANPCRGGGGHRSSDGRSSLACSGCGSRTLLTVAALTGAFYLVLPQLAQVESSWRALQSAQWAWVPVVIACSAMTYVAGATSLLGSVSIRLPFWPTVLAQGASSFVNRVSPSNVGGMALNVRYLQKSGVEPTSGVSAVGVNALAGVLVHFTLLALFFAWAGRNLSNAFSLPSSSNLLVVLAVVAAVVGIAMATRQGRRFAARKLLPGVKTSFANLREVAHSPVKVFLLFGGSTVVTLAYIGGLAASLAAFGGGVGIAEVGAVYLGASIIAAASPTPGGLGAIEAALVAGLTGVGISAGVAVSAVLTYRLATYWLPVLPGWFSWRVLQRRDYV